MYTHTVPMYTHNYSDFMSAQASIETVSYTDLCFRQKINNVSYVVKNILHDYLPELKRIAFTIELEEDELSRYNYKPALMSADLYGTTEFYYLILVLNNLYRVRDFVDINPVRLLKKSDINEYISKIYSTESAAIKTHNSIWN